MRHITKLLLLLTLLFTATCCTDKIPDNGPLDDMWQLMSVEQLPEGIVTDTKSRQVYWSIRSNLIQFNGIEYDRCYGHFLHIGNNLKIYDLCVESAHEKEEDNDEWITYEQRYMLAPWGLTPEPDPDREGRLYQQFYIEQLDYSRMVLTTPTQRLTFRKF